MTKAQTIEALDGAPLLCRDMTFDRNAIVDEENRIVRVSISSETPYLRRSFFEEPWNEVLSHNSEHVDMSRLQDGAPVLYMHERGGGLFGDGGVTNRSHIGVVENARIEDQRIVGEIRLSKRADVDDLWRDIQDGIQRNVSVGYSIESRTLVEQNDNGPDTYRVDGWTPMEVSLVDIPADNTIGIGRDADTVFFRVHNASPSGGITGGNMSDKTDTPATEPTKTQATPSAPAPADDAAIAAARKAGVEAERQRTAGIRELFDGHAGHDDLLAKCLEDGDCTRESASTQLLAAIGAASKPAGADPTIHAGETSLQKLRAGTIEALTHRGQNKRAPAGNEFAGYSLYMLAHRFAVEQHGMSRVAGLGRMQVIDMAFRAGAGTGDFPNVLLNIGENALMNGFDESPETFQSWTRTGNLSDFKTAHRSSLTTFDKLEQVNEMGEFTRKYYGDRGEPIALGTYGGIFPITRQAIINDQLGAFTDAPVGMGRAAARVPGDLVYEILTGNPALSTGTPLFDASHNNIITPAGPPSEDTVNATRVAMGTQTDGRIKGEGAVALNIVMGYLICPLALQTTSEKLVSSTSPVDAPNAGVTNVFRNAFQVVAEPRLDLHSAVQWYAAGVAGTDTIEVAYLDGVAAPMVDQMPGWTVDGLEYKVRLDVGVAALAYQGLTRNAGA